MFGYYSDIQGQCLNALEPISLSLLCSFLVSSLSDWASLTLTPSSTHSILGRNSSLFRILPRILLYCFPSHSRHVLAWNPRSFWRAVRHHHDSSHMAIIRQHQEPHPNKPGHHYTRNDQVCILSLKISS
jgi:hypothetical protein